jgi:Tfp pilus assembly protein FimT
MIEALMVVAVSGIIVAIAAPRIAETNERTALRTSRQLVSAAFAAARAAALQKGQVSTLTLTSNSATVTVLSGLNKEAVTVYGPIRFDQSANTSIEAVGSAPLVVTFDVRGLASPRLADITQYKIKSPKYSDVVCVSATGFLLPKDCQL